MKRLWCVVVLVAIALGLCFYELFSVKNSYESFMEIVDETRTAVENSDYEKANKLSKKLKKEWEEKEKHLNYILEHSSLDELSRDISELPDYTNNESRDDFLSKNDRIKKQFASLYASELPYGENIF